VTSSGPSPRSRTARSRSSTTSAVLAGTTRSACWRARTWATVARRPPAVSMRG